MRTATSLADGRQLADRHDLHDQGLLKRLAHDSHLVVAIHLREHDVFAAAGRVGQQQVAAAGKGAGEDEHKNSTA